MSVQRAPDTPLLTPADVTPSRADLEVIGVFNPGVVQVGDETVLLLRVAEAVRDVPADRVAVPVIDEKTGALVTRTFARAEVDTRDPRIVVVGGPPEAPGATPRHGGAETLLTSISHLRLARSRDGVRFEVDRVPFLFPEAPYETFGAEDPRITVVDGRFFINYSAVSRHGIATALATSEDMRTVRRRGVIFAPNNRDVTIFPERIGGRYFAHHRPMPDGFGAASIWCATSPDLLAWGDHRHVAGPRAGAWDAQKIGGGAVPFRVVFRGKPHWLAIYHGVTESPMTYALGALLLDHDDPARVVGRSRRPFLSPEAPYEAKGFVDNVVFSCGALLEGDDVLVYYGAADGVTALARVPLAEILDDLAP
jgi:beta-1,2-mannobiose phosphorylase / 1,2-beta-oligomannan phosphorylase